MSYTVSVIIPTYNRAPLLKEAIESVLAQTYPVHELIVVDNGSSDSTAQVVGRFGADVQYVAGAHRGAGAARNTGIAQARGELLAFLDDDDLWVPEGLERGVTRLMDPDAPPVDLVLGLLQRVRSAQDAEGGTHLEPIEHPWGAMTFCTLVLPRTVMARVGSIDETMPYGEDVDWFLRAREMGIRFAILDQVTALYRRHETNMTNDRNATYRHFLRAIKKSIERRAGGGETPLEPIVELPSLRDLQALGERKAEQ